MHAWRARSNTPPLPQLCITFSLERTDVRPSCLQPKNSEDDACKAKSPPCGTCPNPLLAACTATAKTCRLLAVALCKGWLTIGTVAKAELPPAAHTCRLFHAVDGMPAAATCHCPCINSFQPPATDPTAAAAADCHTLLLSCKRRALVSSLLLALLVGMAAPQTTTNQAIKYVACHAPMPSPFASHAACLRSHMHDDGLPGGACNINLLGRGDVQVAQIGLQLLVGGLQVEQGLRGTARRVAWAHAAFTCAAAAAWLVSPHRCCCTRRRRQRACCHALRRICYMTSGGYMPHPCWLLCSAAWSVGQRHPVPEPPTARTRRAQHPAPSQSSCSAH